MSPQLGTGIEFWASMKEFNAKLKKKYEAVVLKRLHDAIMLTNTLAPHNLMEPL